MTDQPEALMQWARDAGSTPEDLVRFAALTIADRDAEIERLREANEAFGKRQEWWNQKMFDMELEIASLNAILEKRK